MLQLSVLTLSCGLTLLAIAGLALCGLAHGQYDSPLSGQYDSPADDQTEESCSEPDNLIDLYRELREQQIQDASVLHDPSPAGVFRSSTATITRLTRERNHHHHHGSRSQPGTHSGVCGCESRDEINHDPNRIPRMLAQTGCRGHACRWPGCRRPRGWQTTCEQIYRNERVRKRNGCLNGVYQYEDTWESIPVGCRCQVYPIQGATRD